MYRCQSRISVALAAMAASIFGAGSAFAAPAPIEPRPVGTPVASVSGPAIVVGSSPLWQFVAVAVVAAGVAAVAALVFSAQRGRVTQAHS